jgi:hypothetical protein
MPPADDSKGQGSDDERQRQAAALNDLLDAFGLTTSEQTGWWNLTAFAELGGRTPTQAWLAGDTELVKSLVEGWYAASAKAAERAAGDPEFLTMLRRKLAELEGGPLNRIA